MSEDDWAAGYPGPHDMEIAQRDQEVAEAYRRPVVISGRNDDWSPFRDAMVKVAQEEAAKRADPDDIDYVFATKDVEGNFHFEIMLKKKLGKEEARKKIEEALDRLRRESFAQEMRLTLVARHPEDHLKTIIVTEDEFEDVAEVLAAASNDEGMKG